MKMVIDCMGSDNGSKATTAGILRFLESHKDVEIIAVGRKEELACLEGKCEIIDTPDVVPMDVNAFDVLRMRKSSMVVALNTFLEREADAIVSAGSTGGFLTSATIKLKLIPGVERAALVAPFPTMIKGKYCTVLDIGANNDNTPSQLYQFATMGRLYTQAVLNIQDPRVYLLSNGTEEEKGSPEVKETHKLLKENNFPNFCGNIEGREALLGDVDVLVTGGFPGNVFLKTAEGVFSMMNKMIKKAFKRNLFSKLGYLFCRKGIKNIKETFDYKSVGGSMLLGVNGVVVKAHGNSEAYGFSCAMDVAYKMAKANIVNLMKDGLNKDGK